MGWAPSVCAGPLTTSLRGLWVSVPPAAGQWRTERKGGDPITDQEGTTRTPGWHPEETEAQLPQKEVLSNQRGLQRTIRGGGAKTPLCEGKGPENPGVVAPFPFAGCRGNRRRAVLRRLRKFDGGACSSWTSLTRLLRFPAAVCFTTQVVDVPVVLCNGVPQVQSVSLSVASVRHVTSMTHRIACLRAVHVTALPYFTRLPVSWLSQQTREQARAITEFSVFLAVFYHFRFSLGFGNFPNFWVQPSRSAFAGESGTLSHPGVCKSNFLFHLKVLQVQFLAKF